ncbi:hypothetical protein Aeqsu_1652 [Aequorivita sublithincola DSM 14238]|uniref:Uncharacterized protein n=1 Tax=Aequorivita sublithincola (strain DSM 14238 / LMG 21431 / ACAM 643 / 9-3) TaxID=746697 RepID=I3YVW7_AEQSU|nr:hypothetical protein [Aequorivita sublithincola]AFL81135.1 hypothetical protein Aeqsu_1652 [Aequorivita sublithincola DSM 14238]
MDAKNKLIGNINHTQGTALKASQFSFANINKSKNVWWFNIPISKFSDDVHLLLNTPDYAYWVHLPRGFAKGVPFRIRPDKNAVDLEISANPGDRYLRDVKSKGAGFDFEPYVKEKITK